VGVLVTLATGQGLESATVMEIHVLKPDGTTAVWTATKSATEGSIEYITVDGDLDLAGYYSMSAYVEWGESSTQLGEPCSLEIEAVPAVPAATWTYNSDFSTVRDQIRIIVGDTVEADPLINDSEIAQAYANEGTVLDASILAIQWILAKMARDPDTNFDGISSKRSQRHAMLLATLKTLEHRKVAGLLDFSAPSASDIGQVSDVVNFPTEFQHGEATPPPWDVIE